MPPGRPHHILYPAQTTCPPAPLPPLQALSALVEHSGSDVRTAINTLQLLARQHAPSRPLSSSRPHTPSSSQQGASQRRGQRVRITAADIAASGVFGVKDVTHTPLGVVQDMLASNGSRAMAARLQHLAAAMKAEQRGAAGPSRHGRRGAEPPASLSAAAAARLALQEHYNTLLDLGEHEQVRTACFFVSTSCLWVVWGPAGCATPSCASRPLGPVPYTLLSAPVCFLPAMLAAAFR